MRAALQDAEISPDRIDYINAHGTSTLINDRSETQAIKKVFGKSAYATPISSNKSMLGHWIAAAGSIELSVSVMTIHDADAGGSAEVSATLHEGQSYHVRGGVRAGAAVAASEPVQAALITGDVCATYQSRWFSLEPERHWGSSVYAPVGTQPDHPTTVFVFNPGAGPVTVRRETLSEPDAWYTIAAGGVGAFTVPNGSGARFSSLGGEPILSQVFLARRLESPWGFKSSRAERLQPHPGPLHEGLGRQRVLEPRVASRVPGRSPGSGGVRRAERSG